MGSASPSPPQVGLRSFRRLALVSCIATYLLIFVGGLVRVSGAGLGCPDWPRCFGRFVPPLDPSQVPPEIDPSLFNVTLAWIEYTNRLVGVTVGLLILATGIWALARFRHRPALWAPAVAAALLVAFEGWLGSVVVSSLLEPWIVTAHLVLALVIGSLLLHLVLESYYLEHPEEGAGSRYPPGTESRLALLWGLALFESGLGAHIRGSLEQLRDAYPLLTDRQLLDRLGAIRSVHLAAGLLLAALTAVVAIRVLLRSHRPSAVVTTGATAALGLIALQIAIGFGFVLTGIPAVVQLFHQWVASLFLGLLLVWWRSSRGGGQATALEATPPVVAPGGRFGLLGAGLAGGLLLLAVALLVVALAQQSLRELPVHGTLPELELDASGREAGGDTTGSVPQSAASPTEGRLDPNEGRFRKPGSVSIVAVLPPDCDEACRALKERLAELHRATAASERVRVIAVGTDEEPGRTALAVGPRDGGWIDLRASAAEIERLHQGGLGNGPPGRLALVDGEGRVRGRYDGLDPASIKVLKSHLRQLVAAPP